MTTNYVECHGPDCYICKVFTEETGQFLALNTGSSAQTVDKPVDK